MPIQRDPATASRNYVEAEVDGQILQPIINSEVVFNEEKKRFVEIDEWTP
jgi:hypothetical protein